MKGNETQGTRNATISHKKHSLKHTRGHGVIKETTHNIIIKVEIKKYIIIKRIIIRLGC